MYHEYSYEYCRRFPDVSCCGSDITDLQQETPEQTKTQLARPSKPKQSTVLSDAYRWTRHDRHKISDAAGWVRGLALATRPVGCEVWRGGD